MARCKRCKKKSSIQTIQCDVCKVWMCWECSKVTDEEKKFVEKTEEIEGLYWACDKCAGNIKEFKRGGAQHLKKAMEKLTEEKNEMQEKLEQEISEKKIEEFKEIAEKLVEDEMENKEERYNNIQRALEDKEIIIDEMKFESQDMEKVNLELKIKIDEAESKAADDLVKYNETKEKTKKLEKEMKATNVEIKKYIESTEKLKEEEASLKANNAILIERVEELKGLVKSLECIISEDKKESEKRLKAAQDAKYYQEKGHKNDNPHKENRGQALQSTRDMVFERSTTYSRKDEDHNKEYYQNQGDNYNRKGNSNENRYDQEFFGGKICKHYAYGKNCRFEHIRICKQMATRNECSYGTRCKFSHDLRSKCRYENTVHSVPLYLLEKLASLDMSAERILKTDTRIEIVTIQKIMNRTEIMMRIVTGDRHIKEMEK